MTSSGRDVSEAEADKCLMRRSLNSQRGMQNNQHIECMEMQVREWVILNQTPTGIVNSNDVRKSVRIRLLIDTPRTLQAPFLFGHSLPQKGHDLLLAASSWYVFAHTKANELPDHSVANSAGDKEDCQRERTRSDIHTFIMLMPFGAQPPKVFGRALTST